MKLYQQLKNIYHFWQAYFWRAYYGWPDKGLKIFGVTGTNGKTTTCILLGSILREKYGTEKVGLLTTIFFWLGKKEVVNKTKMTTMDSRDVFKYLRQMKDAGVRQVVLELTSHALDQNRLAGIRLEGGIILNISREHLDYHGTMEKYAKAKIKIVKYMREGVALVMSKQFSINDQVINSKKLKKIIFTSEQTKNVKTALVGEWNKENVLAACLLAKEIGIKKDTIKKGVSSVGQIQGRMEWIESEPRTQNTKSRVRWPRVVIDYAVTPNALEGLYREIKNSNVGSKIFAVLGACGNRDRGKRAEMVRVVAKYADELVLTREDPWDEDEEQIFGDLEQGLRRNSKFKNQMSNSGVMWRRIVDRREAIKYCLQKAELNDVVVVTGKGAEEGMAVGNKIIAWNDKKVILELMKEVQGNV